LEPAYVVTIHAAALGCIHPSIQGGFIDNFEVLRIDAQSVPAALSDNRTIGNRCHEGGVTGAVCALDFVSA
jgi:hypothetical protein